MRTASHISLERKALLYRVGRPQHIYFLTEGVASVRGLLRDGSSCEVAMHGCASAPGATALLGSGEALSVCEMESPGAAYRLDLTDAKQLFSERPDFRNGLLGTVHDHIRVQELNTVCASCHELEQRLARWLLSYSQLLGSHRLPLTQDDIAKLLGARRPTISTLIGGFRALGAIESGREFLTILDSDTLKKSACECYLEWRKVFQKRIGTGAPRSSGLA